MRERDYYTLKKLLKEIRTKDLAYSMMCNAVKDKLQSEPEGLYNMLPGAAAKDLQHLIKTEIPAEQENQAALKKELEEWDRVIETCISFAGTDRESIVDNLYNADSNGDYLVHKCIRHNLDMDNLTFIIKKTQNLNARNNSGYTPLHTSMRCRNLDVFNILLNNGVSTSDSFPDGMPPLVYIVDYFGSSADDWGIPLIQRGYVSASHYKYNGEKKASILMRVIIHHNLPDSTKERLVRSLLDYGAHQYGCHTEGGGWSKYYQDIQYWWPLFAALERKQREIVRMLLPRLSRLLAECNISRVITMQNRLL